MRAMCPPGVHLVGRIGIDAATQLGLKERKII
jgi:hypothetical protein